MNNIQASKQLDSRLFHILLVLLLLNMVNQTLFYVNKLLYYKHFFMFAVQCENFLMLIFNGMPLTMETLIKISSFTSFSNILPIIINKIGSNIIETNELKCICANNTKMAMKKNNSHENRTEIELLWISNDMMQEMVEPALILSVSTKFGAYTYTTSEFAFNVGIQMAFLLYVHWLTCGNAGLTSVSSYGLILL